MNIYKAFLSFVQEQQLSDLSGLHFWSSLFMLYKFGLDNIHSFSEVISHQHFPFNVILFKSQVYVIFRDDGVRLA